MGRSCAIAVPLLKAEDVIPHLARAYHWKQGYSAKALADRWFRADGVPGSVRALLEQAPALAGAELLDGWLERQTDLGDGLGRASQTDLLCILGKGDELIALGIEAKVRESAGSRIADWLASGGGRPARLAHLCALLGLDQTLLLGLRYQFLHRTAAIVLEARRYRARKAGVVIESFCPKSTGLEDGIAFFEAIGFAGFMADALAGPIRFAGVDLWAGWASDQVPEEIAQ